MSPPPPHWEHFEHDADVGVRGFGHSEAQAFEQAALALTAIAAEPGAVAAIDEVAIDCNAPDLELLFVDWLNALICEMSTRKMIFSRFEVSLNRTQLSAHVWGEPVSTHRHHPAVEIKGATYTALRVAQEDGQWIAQTVVDV